MGILVINGLFFSYMIVHVTPFFYALSGNYKVTNSIIRSSHLEVFLGKGVLKICNKFTGEHPCRSVISINLLCNLLKSHFGAGVLLQICCIFSERLFLITPLGGCFWIIYSEMKFFQYKVEDCWTCTYA